MKNKMEIHIKFKDENGIEEIRPTIVEVDVTEYKEFENFRERFDKLERATLRARKEVTEKALESYMEEISKKSL